MNYRHAFHAGNFADCFKHALLVALVDQLTRKPSPFCVLDTHAGAGHYDLASEAARKTEEAADGICRLLEAASAAGPEHINDSSGDAGRALDRYLGLVRALGLYPGSPVLIRALLRPQDRLVCCELHPEEATALKRLFHRAANAEIHARSGWEALRALLPPRERRGLVFIDPPFENRSEFSDLAASLRTGHARFGNGVFAAWYPVKRMAAVRDFHATMKASGLRDIITVEIHLREPVDPERLNGCGMLVINPPWQYAQQAQALAQAVLNGLGAREQGAGVRLVRLADE